MFGTLRVRSRAPILLAIDQVLSMASNLVVTIAILRRGGESALGSFAATVAAFTAYLVLQRALLSEPATAARRSDGESDRALAASCCLCLLAAIPSSLALLLLVELGVPGLLPLAALLPLLALEDNARYMSSRLGRPEIAVAMDGLWFVAVLGILLARPDISGNGIIWIWAGAGALGLVPGLLLGRTARILPASIASAGRWWRNECAVVGRATGLDMAISQIYSQGAIFILLPLSGVVAAGEYRAAQSLFGVCLAVIVALNMYSLPRMRAYGASSAGVLRLAGQYLAAVAVVGGATLVLSHPLQNLAFGRVVVETPLALATLALFCGLGLSSALAVVMRVHAADQLSVLIFARLLMLLVGGSAMLLGARVGGISGLVWAQAAGVVLFVVVAGLGIRAASRAKEPSPMRGRRRFPSFWVHERATGIPVVATAYCWARGLRNSMPDRRSDLVIEGFPRSANTYARAGFLDANPHARVASHLHNARSVRLAVRRGTPVLVLVREPVSAVTSLMVRDRRLNPETAFRAYARFYRAVLPLADRVVLAHFPDVLRRPGALHRDVVDDLGQVIERVNARFGCEFALYRPDPDSEQRVRTEIDRLERQFAHGVLDELAVARPSTQRGDVAAQVRLAITGPAFDGLVTECQAAYSAILGQLQMERVR